MDRRRFARWAAPVAFLAAITIGVLVVRAGLEHGKKHHAQPTTSTNSRKTHRHGHRRPHVRRYIIRSGDTLASIAAKTGTTVTRLEQLNPGVDPTALTVGQTIRVQ